MPPGSECTVCPLPTESFHFFILAYFQNKVADILGETRILGKNRFGVRQIAPPPPHRPAGSALAEFPCIFYIKLELTPEEIIGVVLRLKNFSRQLLEFPDDSVHLFQWN